VPEHGYNFAIPIIIESNATPDEVGSFVLKSAVPIILFALLLLFCSRTPPKMVKALTRIWSESVSG